MDAAKDMTDAAPTGSDNTAPSPRPPALFELMSLQTNQKTKQATASFELADQLASAEKFLQEQTPYATQTAYERCDEATRRKVVLLLEAETARIEDQKDDEGRRRHEQDLVLFNMADSLFQVFLPAGCQGPTVTKFWGAIMALCTVCLFGILLNSSRVANSLFQAPRLAYTVRDRTETLAAQLESSWSVISAFDDIMSFMSDEARNKIEPPRQFVTAWLHTLSGLVLCAVGLREWEIHFTRVRRLLADGMEMAIQSISTHKLLSSCTVLPLEVASLTTLKLLQDQVGSADDLSETYSQYLNSLVSAYHCLAVFYLR